MLLVEALARVVEIWHTPVAVDVGAGFTEDSRVYVPAAARPGWLETSPTKLGSFLAQQFTVPKPDRTLRVFVVGGSSVHRLDVELGEMERILWTKLQPRYQRVEVVNAGGFAYGSARLVTVVSEVLRYEPDVVAYYEANNEFEEAEQRQLAGLEGLSAQRWTDRSAAMRLVRDVMLRREIDRLRREHEARAAKGPGEPDNVRAWERTFTPDEVAQRMADFRTNVTAALRACRSAGVPVVIGTVPSNLVRPALWGRPALAYQPVRALLQEGRFDEADALGRRVLAEAEARHQSSDLENAILREVARDLDVPLADVEAAVRAAEPHHVPGETLFADHCHLNERGNAILRETLTGAILTALTAKR